MSPVTLVKIARLTFLGRLASKAPQELISILLDMSALSHGWSATVLSDLRWLSVHEWFSPCIGFSLSEWVDAIRDNPKKYKQQVNKYAKTRMANIYVGDPTHAMQILHVDSHRCGQCEARFGTLQQFSLHMFKKHGVRNVMRLYINNHVHCTVCLRQFWSRARLLNHIKYRSKICKYNLFLRGTVSEESEALAYDVEAAAANAALYRRGRRNHHAEEPVIQLQGPLLPIVPPTGFA